MGDVKWIKIVTNIFDNRKVKQIETLPEGDGIIVIWFKLMCLAGEINDNGLIYLTKDIPYTEQMLASQFNRPLAMIQLALKTFESFGMIEITDNILRLSNWEKYQNIEGLDKIREQTKQRVAKCREKQKQLKSAQCNATVTLHNATSNATVTLRNAIEEDKDNRIDIEKKEILLRNIKKESDDEDEPNVRCKEIRDFCDKFDVGMDNYNPDLLTEIDFNLLTREFELSKKILQGGNWFRSFSNVVKGYRKIITGCYRDTMPTTNTERKFNTGIRKTDGSEYDYLEEEAIANVKPRTTV